MKRYWLFGGEYYYAKGGMNDLQTMSDDFMALKAEAEVEYSEGNLDWWHITDIESLRTEARSEHQAHGVRSDDNVPYK